ncbi:TRBP2 protein, partial [Ramphastos sulfuratus]|nr:TRBP2 protein [Ramphastos sulfuratus]
SLEQMLATNPGKTPISLLQEYGTRIGKTPGYDLLKAEGQAHQPNFTFRVTVGDISCTGGHPLPWHPPQIGTGCLGNPLRLAPTQPCRHFSRPSQAQHLPGRDKWTLNRESSQQLPSGHSSAPSPGAGMFSSPEAVPLCPPQELVVQKGWRLPEYTVTQESGPAHRKEFTMTCRVERFVEIGLGTSKKLAKRNAAAKMLVRIHNVPMEPREGSEAEVEEDQFSMAGPRLEGLRGRAPGCTWDSLRNSVGEKMAQLR